MPSKLSNKRCRQAYTGSLSRKEFAIATLFDFMDQIRALRFPYEFRAFGDYSGATIGKKKPRAKRGEGGGSEHLQELAGVVRNVIIRL
jgi:hypothetical protein